MPAHREPLSGGLWTAKDPGLLEVGQLQDARNVVYLPGSDGLWMAPGRQVFGAVSAQATAVDGLRDVEFDTGDHYLLALAGDTLRYATVGDSGTFTTLTAAGTGSQTLEAIQYQNAYYLFTGASAAVETINTNKVVYLSATAAGTAPSVRQHGMLPVNTAPVSASANSTFSQSVTGYYEYWTTEVAKLSADGVVKTIESTFTGKPATVFVSATSYSPVIAMPAVRNAGFTTHWRVYRSPKKTFETDQEFPTGFLISEVATATGQIVDGGPSTITSYAFPTTYNSMGYGSDFGLSATALGASDAVSASAVHSGVVPTLYKQLCYGFNFGGFTGPVRGIEVELRCRTANRNQTVGVQICKRNPTTGEPMAPIGGKSAVVRNVISLITLGGATDTWGAVWSDSDFDTNWALVVEPFLVDTDTFTIDYARARVYYGTTNVYQDIQFPTVVYTFGDITSQVGKNGPPPSSDTAAVFEDQLVVNDKSNAALIRYSYPGDMDAFPETYFVDYETDENDRVKAVRVINEQLVVWLNSSTWRQVYLPSERDASFDRGKSKARISGQYGCIDPMCVAAFSPGGGADLAAFVSYHGVHATDGFNLETYTDGLNWDTIFPPGSTPVALINDRRRCLLLFYFQNTANYGSETFLCLPFAYGEGHWIDGRPKVCSLIHMRNHSGGTFASLESAWSVQRDNGAVSVYLGYGGTDTAVGAGKVYIESTAASNPALDPRPQFVTREIYGNDFGGEWKVGDVHAYAHDYTANATAIYTTKTRKTNDTALFSRGSKTVIWNGAKLNKVGAVEALCEAASITFVATATNFCSEFLLIDGLEYGLEDSGRS